MIHLSTYSPNSLVSLLRITTRNDRTYLDVNQWQDLISSSMPHLKNFRSPMFLSSYFTGRFDNQRFYFIVLNSMNVVFCTSTRNHADEFLKWNIFLFRKLSPNGYRKDMHHISTRDLLRIVP